MRATSYDSDFCGKLPVHLTNLIQPYGALLVVESVDGKIIQVSENIVSLFNQPLDKIINQPLRQFLSSADADALAKKLSVNINRKFPVVISLRNQGYIALIHKATNYITIEVELQPINRSGEETFLDLYQETKFVMARIESATSIQEACDITASELRRFSGFDKVMIYQFDAQWNGTVLTEYREESMESYLHVTFPASDIPKPARDLYHRNPFRFIPDRDYSPVKLFPVINPVTNSFLDMSDCNLRSVAGVHIEYLKNMGVASSMSTRILVNEQLWGLIACHHRTARFLNYEMCSVFEMISSILSVKISSLQNQHNHSIASEMSSTYSQFVEQVYRKGNLDNALLRADGVMKLFDATGAIVSRGGRFTTTGIVPSDQQIDDLILWLHTRQLTGVFHSDALSEQYEEAAAFSDSASGIVAIPLNVQRDEYVIVVRPEVSRTITWGGNPDERIRFEPDQRTYHPRNSFQQWRQNVKGTSRPWSPQAIHIAESLRSFIYEYEATVV